MMANAPFKQREVAKGLLRGVVAFERKVSMVFAIAIVL